MSDNDNPAEAEWDSPQSLAEEAFRASQRAQQTRRAAQAAQRSAADSLVASADSYDRTAKAYEEAAVQNERRKDEYRQYAAQHRKYAQGDRCMAQQLRQMAESDAMDRHPLPLRAVRHHSRKSRRRGQRSGSPRMSSLPVNGGLPRQTRRTKTFFDIRCQLRRNHFR
ncbi:MAG TPA: hypothetical protein VME67_09275 [Mycobacterium sp.]|nr:hypothetical protein [Mycobacterium sp.]HTX95015.1 hypothetical protein [Mycobacterium sp.]